MTSDTKTKMDPRAEVRALFERLGNDRVAIVKVTNLVDRMTKRSRLPRRKQR